MPKSAEKIIEKTLKKLLTLYHFRDIIKTERGGTPQRKEERKMTAKTLLATMTTAQLIEQFVLTGKMEYTPELPTVRGWYMDELEERNPEAFEAWLDMDAPEDEDLYKFYNVA